MIKKFIYKLIPLAIAVPVAGIMFGLVVLTIGYFKFPLEGPEHCVDDLKENYPNFLTNNIRVNSIFTRTTREGAWMSAVIYQPQDIEKDKITAICYFGKSNYVLHKIEFKEGDFSSQLKDVSYSNYNPLYSF